MESLNRKVVLGVVLVMIATLFVVINSVWKSQKDTFPNTINGAQPPEQIEGTKIPNGWYTHEARGLESTSTVLTRAKKLSYGTTEQIGISIMETSLTPKDFISRQGAVGGYLDLPDTQWIWGIYQGHKMFSIILISGSTVQWFVYLFGGNKVYQFNLLPNDQTNPNLKQDRIDFWKVITYYAQDPSFK